MSVFGIGIDIVKNSRIKTVISKSYGKRFLVKVLHEDQLSEFQKFKTNIVQVQYLASRWAVKQAAVKAIGKKQLIFNEMKIYNNNEGNLGVIQGQPQLHLTSDFNKRLMAQLKISQIIISYTYEEQITMGQAIAIS